MASLSLAHLEALAPAGHVVVARLAKQAWSEEFYLAGSTALALYLGHRPVRELDLMTGTNRLTGPERRDLLADLLVAGAEVPAVEVETARDGYLFCRLEEGLNLKLYYYPYPLVDPLEEFAGMAVASAVDLGLMKLAAIISRGTRRDFVDLYLLCQEIPLATLLARAGEKFGHVRDFPLQALKGLADLACAREEPMPPLARPLPWSAVEEWLQGEVRSLGRARVGLPEGE